jgi:hypothetical protein
MAVHGLVDAVVENFPNEVMQPSRADTADIHTWPLSDRFKTL